MKNVENLQKKVVEIAEDYADMVKKMITNKDPLPEINEGLRMLNNIADTLYKVSASDDAMAPNS